MGQQFLVSSFLSFLYIGLTLAILVGSGNIKDEMLWFRMLHIWQSIMLVASFANLGGILSGLVAFLSLKILLSCLCV